MWARLCALTLLLAPASASYTLQDPTWDSSSSTFSASLSSSSASTNPYGDDFASLSFSLSVLTSETARIRITTPDAERYEIPESVTSSGPVTLPSSQPISIDDASFDFTYTSSPFTFKISDKSDPSVIVFELNEDFSFSDQYIKFSTSMNSESKLFGLGEKSRSNGAEVPPGSKTTMWARDMAAAVFDTNLYASHPFYVELSSDGSAHGSFLRNSNGLDVTYSESRDSLTFEALGGIVDLYTFVGPSPTDVAAQYQQIVGFPRLQPYWSLGFHQCRYGYENLQEAIDVVSGYKDASIPLDIAWLDIDYMNLWLDFTYDEANFPSSKVSAFVDELHSNGQKFVPIVDPGILAVDSSWDWAQGYDAYDKGMEMDVFVKDLNGEKPYMGQVWPGPVHFPDWFHPNATDYWTEQLKNWHDIAAFDGVWVDMNEVSNFCTGQVCENDSPDTCPTHQVDTQTQCCLSCVDVDQGNKFDNPKFMIGNDEGINDGGNPSPINFKTIPASAKHYGGLSQYDVHNLHGTMEAKVTSDAMEAIRDGKRSFVLSRSSFPGHGNHASHWTGDNAATWDDLKRSIVTVNDFAMFGISMVGADICGFIGDSWEELCARWIEVGAFHPFSRNHNTYGAAPQEFYRWDTVAEASRRALGMRYKILPFLYTLMYKANAGGDLVSRYLWQNFPQDAETHGIDEQFMLGDALLISPVLEEAARSVEAYFPQGTWYNIFDFSKVVQSEGEKVALNAELEEVNVHIRAGSIIAMQEGGLTTVESRGTDFSLLVALCGEGCTSFGELYLDDGESVQVEDSILADIVGSAGELAFSVTKTGTYEPENANLSSVKILGVDQPVGACEVNGSAVEFDYDNELKILTISLEGKARVDEDFALLWK